MKIKQNIPIVLASGSQIRKLMLKKIGLKFDLAKSDVDEELIKKENISLDFQALALKLAQAKAMDKTQNFSDSLIIGSDQICSIEKQIFSKPKSVENAIKQLKQMRNQIHTQTNGTCIVQNGTIIWQNNEVARIKMRNLTDDEIEKYIQADMPLQACGSYQFESNAKFIFDWVEGSDDTILGLPIVPLLSFLFANKFIEIS